MSDPTYVRLANRLSRGMVVDLETGWSIAGLDVKEFPKEGTAAKKFVRTALNNGKLEPASKAEYEDAHEDDEAMLEAMREQHPEFGTSPQEAKVRRAHQKAQKRLEAKRGDQRSQEEAYDEDVRQARLARKGSVQAVSEDDLDEMGKAELQERCEALGLPKSGNMEELRQRILDAQEEDEEDEDE